MDCRAQCRARETGSVQTCSCSCWRISRADEASSVSTACCSSPRAVRGQGGDGEGRSLNGEQLEAHTRELQHAGCHVGRLQAQTAADVWPMGPRLRAATKHQRRHRGLAPRARARHPLT
eukprot:scaffold293764_cov30-Tisochrysis_lutea.AAC.7